MSTPAILGLNTLLQRVEENWASAEAHQALLRYATEQCLLAQVASFYRENISNAARREVSEEHLGTIQVLALSTLERSRAAHAGSSRLKKGLAVGFCAIILGCALTLLRLCFA